MLSEIFSWFSKMAKPNPPSVEGTTIKKPRVATVDILKGITISLVVARHIPEMATLMPDRIFFGLGLLRLPLFFFLSGVFLKAYSWQLLKKKFSQIMIPFYLASIGFGLVYYYFLGGDLAKTALSILYATGKTLPVSPLWYLPTLFFALVVSSLFIKFYEQGGSKVIKLAIFAVACIYLIHRFIDPNYIYEFDLAGLYYRFRGRFMNIDLVPFAALCVVGGVYG